MLAQVAAATVFEDFADNLALKLDTSQAAAGALLGTGVLVAIGFALARLELDVIGIAIVLLAVVGALILIGWMYVWVLILAGLLVAYMVAERMRNPYGG
jgi:hypothetical protein